MKPANAHRKETVLFLGGAVILLIIVFSGIVLFRTGVIGGPAANVIPTKDVNQIVMEMNATMTAQAVSTQQVYLMATATSVAMTANAPTPTSTPTATPEPPIGTTRVSAADGMTEIYISSGTFIMGSTDDFNEAELQEKPQHNLFLNGYWIDQTEVTQGMYKRCVAAGACSEPVHDQETYPTYTNPDNDTYPVVYVNWDQANAFCSWAGRRLPTEAEWEKAARGTDSRLYPWGDTPPNGNQANFGNAFISPRPVGSFPDGKSPYGVLDMIGNVREWVHDVYSEYYYGESPEYNPQGPELSEDHKKRALRGASFKDAVHFTHLAMRFGHVPNSAGDNRGFRCAASY